MANFKSVNGEWFYISNDGVVAKKSMQQGFHLPEQEQGVMLPTPKTITEAPIQTVPVIETVDESLTPLPNPETVLPVSDSVLIKPKKGGRPKKITS